MRVKYRCKSEDLDADNNQMLITFIYFIKHFDKINEDGY